MRIVVVRHAEKSPVKPHLLTPGGLASAKEAAFWLQSHGVLPVLVAHTHELRTRQTVGAILSTYGMDPNQIASLPPGSMPVNMDGWTRLRTNVHEKMRVLALEGDVLLCVHGPTQDFVVHTFGAEKPPKANRGAAFLLTTDDGPLSATTCIATWPGHPKGWEPGERLNGT